MGILEALTLIFVAAKLFGAITWSWWVIFSPLAVSCVGYLVIAAFVVRKFDKNHDKIRSKRIRL